MRTALVTGMLVLTLGCGSTPLLRAVALGFSEAGPPNLTGYGLRVAIYLVQDTLRLATGGWVAPLPPPGVSLRDLPWVVADDELLLPEPPQPAQARASAARSAAQMRTLLARRIGDWRRRHDHGRHVGGGLGQYGRRG